MKTQMNLIKQGFLMAAAGFIISLLATYPIDGKINWIIASGMASGFLFGNLIMYLWHKDAEKRRCN